MKAYGENFWRLVCSLARRLCAWCSAECIATSLEMAKRGLFGGECRHIVRDAILAAEAGLVWHSAPSLDASFEEVFRWAAQALYVASVAEVYASRHSRPLVASRGLFTRRVVERFLHDYWLSGGPRLLVTDVRTRLGWIAIPKLGSCACKPITSYRFKNGDVLVVNVSCCEHSVEAEARPPLAARLRIESL